MVLAKSRRQRTVLDRIVKCERAIKMRSTLREVSRVHQGRSHHAMPYHKRNGRPLFFGKRQALGREVATGIAVECN